PQEKVIVELLELVENGAHRRLVDRQVVVERHNLAAALERGLQREYEFEFHRQLAGLVDDPVGANSPLRAERLEDLPLPYLLDLLVDTGLPSARPLNGPWRSSMRGVVVRA